MGLLQPCDDRRADGDENLNRALVMWFGSIPFNANDYILSCDILRYDDENLSGFTAFALLFEVRRYLILVKESRTIRLGCW